MNDQEKKFNWFAYIGDKIVVALMLAAIITAMNYYVDKEKSLDAVEIEDTNKAMAVYDELTSSVSEYHAKLKAINDFKKIHDDKTSKTKITKMEEESRILHEKYDAIYLQSKLSLNKQITSQINQKMQFLNTFYSLKDRLMFEDMPDDIRKEFTKLHTDMEIYLNTLDIPRKVVRAFVMSTLNN